MRGDDTEREIDVPEGHATMPALEAPDGAADDLALDEDDEWTVSGPATQIRLKVPTAALAAVVLVAAGFWGGAVVEKHHGTAPTGSSAASAFAARFRARGATGAAGAAGARGATGAAGFGGGFGGFGGAGSAAAAGTISVVTGKTLYVLTSAGALVKVTLGPSTAITRDASAPAVDLRPGDTVVVQGTAAANGNVTATSVSATAPTGSAG